MSILEDGRASLVVFMIQLWDFIKELVSSPILVLCFSASPLALYKRCSLKNTFSIHTPICLKLELEICNVVPNVSICW